MTTKKVLVGSPSGTATGMPATVLAVASATALNGIADAFVAAQNAGLMVAGAVVEIKEVPSDASVSAGDTVDPDLRVYTEL